jgi:hypothetical protein
MYTDDFAKLREMAPDSDGSFPPDWRLPTVDDFERIRTESGCVYPPSFIAFQTKYALITPMSGWDWDGFGWAGSDIEPYASLETIIADAREWGVPPHLSPFRMDESNFYCFDTSQVRDDGEHPVVFWAHDELGVIDAPHLCWNNFCDWLIRGMKEALENDEMDERKQEATDKFANHVYERARQAIASFPDATTADIYAISFWYRYEEDDPRRARLEVGYNTNARWRACTPRAGQELTSQTASGPEEAKWNFAFWLDDVATEIGQTKADAAARQQWIKSLGLSYSDEEDNEDFERTSVLGEEIQYRFVDICEGVAKRLHDDGVVIRKFGRPVPIIVHELQYWDRIAKQTARANPPGLTQEFTDWIASMYEENP